MIKKCQQVNTLFITLQISQNSAERRAKLMILLT